MNEERIEMFGSKEQAVQMLVARLQSRADGIGMKAALDEAGDILREAARRVGHGRQEGGYAGGLYQTQEPVATLPVGLRHPAGRAR